MKCKRCDVEMVNGIAIKADDRGFGFPDVKNHETIKVIDCLKCPKCGYSDDNNPHYRND